MSKKQAAPQRDVRKISLGDVVSIRKEKGRTYLVPVTVRCHVPVKATDAQTAKANVETKLLTKRYWKRLRKKSELDVRTGRPEMLPISKEKGA